MSVLGYEPSLQMAFADNPVFPDQHEAEQAENDVVLDVEEWRTYYARFYSGHIPESISRSKYVVKVSSGFLEFNFRNFVGLSKIGSLRLRVINRKIGQALYEAILDELADSYAGLVFGFASPVGQHHKKQTPGKDTLFIEYLFLRKFLLRERPDIEELCDLIIQDPHRMLTSETVSCPVHQCLTINQHVLSHLLAAPKIELSARHNLRNTDLAAALYRASGKHLFPKHGAREVKRFIVDTPENRFVKFFLRSLLARLEQLEHCLTAADYHASYFNPDINLDITLLRQKISRVLAHALWREVGPMRTIPANSQVMQRKNGYRQLFQLFSLLRLATRCDFLSTDFENLIDLKDLPTIYEYWCFFQIKKIIDSLLVARKAYGIINSSPLTSKLSYGICVKYQNNVCLYFNKTYSGSQGIAVPDETSGYRSTGASYSHALRPDIAVTQGSRKLFFDAKYKGKTGGFYGDEQNGNIIRWKDEDIDKMHCYREAISDVCGSFVLYPGIENIVFPCHAAGNEICQGVGAIALRPHEGGCTDQERVELIPNILVSFLKSNHTEKGMNHD